MERFAKFVREMLTRISPKLNTRVLYFVKFKKILNLKKPVTLNEKILWLKFNTYWENNLVKKCADKYKVRDYIEELGCGEILNELYGVYESVEEIEWEKFPQKYVIKLNVGCGFNIIVRDSSIFDIDEASILLRKWMNEKYYLGYSEMQYKDVKPYIIVEKFLEPTDDGQSLPEDFKFYCYSGDAKYVMMCTDRDNEGHNAKYLYYDSDWNLQTFTQYAKDNYESINIEKPEGIDEAFSYASKLSEGFPFVRVDLYIISGKVFFGELTFTPGGGLDNLRPVDTDRFLGSFLEIE